MPSMVSGARRGPICDHVNCTPRIVIETLPAGATGFNVAVVCMFCKRIIEGIGLSANQSEHEIELTLKYVEQYMRQHFLGGGDA